MAKSKTIQKKFAKASDLPGLKICVEADCTMHPEATTNFMHMTFADVSAEVSEGKKHLGSIRGCVGGGVELNDERTGISYTIGYKKLWAAFQEALK